MSSSKILPGCLASLVAVVVFFLSWVALPSVRSEAEIKKVLARQQQAFEDDQKTARDPGRNAFIDPQLAPYWGRKSIEYKNQSGAADAVVAMRGVGFLAAESEEEHSKLAQRWKKKDEALRTTVEGFEALYPVLQRALKRPCFVLPSSETPNFESEPANFLSLRSIAQALSAYAEVQLAEGKPAAALDAALDILTLSRLVVAQKAHPLISTMVASAIQTTAQETLGYVLQSAPGLSEGDLRKALAALESSAVNRELGLQSMEYELWVAHNAFSNGPADTVWKGALLRLPGMWKREWRLFQNDFYPLLEAGRAGKPFQTAWLNQFSLMNWVMGQHSLTSQSLIPNFERVMSLLEISRRRQNFLHLYVQLRLRKRQGKLPKEVSPGWLGNLEPQRVSYRVEKGEPYLEYDLDSGLAQALPQANTPRRGSARWENLMRPHWAIPVAP